MTTWTDVPIEPVATEWRKLLLVVAGRSPLLLHDRLAMVRADEWRRANPREKAPPAAVEAEMGCLRDPRTGIIVIRSDALLESAKTGAKEVLWKPRQGGRARNAVREVSSAIVPARDTFKLFRPPVDLTPATADQYIDQMLVFTRDDIDLDTLKRDAAPLEPITEYEIDVRRCIVQRQGVMRARPLIDLPWACVAEFEYDAGLGTAEGEPVAVKLYLQALGYAGQIVGIGNYRPERGGRFGKFAVVKAWLL